MRSCNLKTVFVLPATVKAFLPSRISYLRCYFQDLLTGKGVVAAKLSIMVRPNTILKFEFVNIYVFHISLTKRLTTRSYENFSILNRESNDLKLKIMESLLTACGKPTFNKVDSSLFLSYFNLTSVVNICLSYIISDVLSHYMMSIYCIVCIQYHVTIFYFIKSRTYEHLISF